MVRTRLIALGVVVITLLVPAMASAQQTVIFVRHAERADGGAGAQTGAMTAPADPSLSAAGEARATRLAALLADAGIKGIYTSEFKRSQETAKPLAARLRIQIEPVPSKDAAGLMSRIKSAHARDTVLVIGHSNTIPELIRAFGGPDLKIADDDYTGIYILAPATGALTIIRY